MEACKCGSMKVWRLVGPSRAKKSNREMEGQAPAIS